VSIATLRRMDKDAFFAVADPTRRRLLDLLAKRERSVGELAKPLA